MSGICGWINFSANDHPDSELLNSMSAPLEKPGDASPARITSPCVNMIGLQKIHQAIKLESENNRIMILGRPVITPEGLARIENSSDNLCARLLQGFDSHGHSFLKYVSGHFVIAAVLGDKKQALLAVDRIARNPLSCFQTGHTLVFGTLASAINRHPEVTAEIDLQSIFNYLYFHYVPSPMSAYKGQIQIPHGHCAVFEENRLSILPYWQIQYQNEFGKQTTDDYRDQLFDLFRKSVNAELEDGENVGAFLSGGIDSSSVVGMLGEVSRKRPVCFSIGFDQEGYDEMEFARIAARHYNAEHVEYYVTPQEIVDSIPLIAAASSQPFGNSSMAPAYYVAKAAREAGITRLLGGDGGDELFAGNTRYVTQHIFAHYEKIPAAVRKLLEPVLDHTPVFSLPLLSKFRSYSQQGRIPMPHRMETYNLLKRLGISNVLTPEFLKQVDIEQPHHLLEEWYQTTPADTLINRMLGMEHKTTLADNDLIKVGTACNAGGVEIAYPLLNDAIIDFATSLPAKLKVNKNQLRPFYKEAMKNFLPNEIITKKKQGFGLPVGHWMLSHQPFKSLTIESINSLTEKGWIKKEFANNLMTDLLPSFPGYYGTIAWILVMLHSWLEESRNIR